MRSSRTHAQAYTRVAAAAAGTTHTPTRRSHRSRGEAPPAALVAALVQPTGGGTLALAPLLLRGVLGSLVGCLGSYEVIWVVYEVFWVVVRTLSGLLQQDQQRGGEPSSTGRKGTCVVKPQCSATSCICGSKLCNQVFITS